jgi:hypothetical protein
MTKRRRRRRNNDRQNQGGHFGRVTWSDAEVVAWYLCHTPEALSERARAAGPASPSRDSFPLQPPNLTVPLPGLSGRPCPLYAGVESRQGKGKP